MKQKQLLFVLCLGLLLLSAPFARAQIVRSGEFICDASLVTGLCPVAVLNWTVGGQPIAGSGDGWSCGNTHNTLQPGQANGWRLDISSQGIDCASIIICSKSHSFHAGDPQSFKVQCNLGRSKFAFSLR